MGCPFDGRFHDQGLTRALAQTAGYSEQDQHLEPGQKNLSQVLMEALRIGTNVAADPQQTLCAELRPLEVGRAPLQYPSAPGAAATARHCPRASEPCLKTAAEMTV